MTVILTPQHEALIRQKVDRGLYRSVEEAIGAAVRPLDEHDLRLQQVRAAIQIGLESGEGILLTSEVMDEIEQEAEAAYQRGEQPSPDVCP